MLTNMSNHDRNYSFDKSQLIDGQLFFVKSIKSAIYLMFLFPKINNDSTFLRIKVILRKLSSFRKVMQSNLMNYQNSHMYFLIDVTSDVLYRICRCKVE